MLKYSTSSIASPAERFNMFYVLKCTSLSIFQQLPLPISQSSAELKQSHGLAKCKYVGLLGMKKQIFFTAFVANVKHIVKLSEMVTA